MAFTKDRVLALVVTIANGVLGAWFGHFSGTLGREAGIAVLLSLPGLAIIWFRESLQDKELAFPRGVRNESPPVLLALLGWLFLLAVTVFSLYRLKEHF
jgi:hypothetical protein